MTGRGMIHAIEYVMYGLVIAAVTFGLGLAQRVPANDEAAVLTFACMLPGLPPGPRFDCWTFRTFGTIRKSS